MHTIKFFSFISIISMHTSAVLKCESLSFPVVNHNIHKVLTFSLRLMIFILLCYQKRADWSRNYQWNFILLTLNLASSCHPINSRRYLITNWKNLCERNSISLIIWRFTRWISDDHQGISYSRRIFFFSTRILFK